MRKCAYCECRLNGDYGHTEHYRPKNGYTTAEGAPLRTPVQSPTANANLCNLIEKTLLWSVEVNFLPWTTVEFLCISIIRLSEKSSKLTF